MFRKLLYIFCWITWMVSPTYAANLKVACAANFTSVMKELTAIYETATGDTVECTFGSTGMLYGQIIKGAPYDIFFAADEVRPSKLNEQGLTFPPALYARGKLVLWSPNPDLASMETWQDVINAASVNRIGIATPKTAPYGQKAMEALAAAKLTVKAVPKLAYGKSVGVSFQYAYSKAADASFIAMSQALSEKGKVGKYWPIPEAEFINQAVCILTGCHVESALMFVNWLSSKEARAVIRKYGYE